MKISEAIDKRWSPRAFDTKELSRSQIKELLNAAETAPSCFNEQPWRYIIGFKGDESYDKIMKCLVEFNQSWAKTAPVLMIGVVSEKFKRNNNVNYHAKHDLGAASAYLTLKAMEQDIFVHQMAGFSNDKARELFEIPEGYESVTALALGYLGDKNQLNDDLRDQESPKRTRNGLEKFAFETNWGNSFS